MNDSLPVIFRRIAISPCNSLVLVPTAISSCGETNVTPVSLLFSTSDVTKPLVSISSDMPTVCAVFSPRKYKKIHKNSGALFDLAHELLFAVASRSSLSLYATTSTKPLAHLSNLHLSNISDVRWVENTIMVSSADGFITLIYLEEKDLKLYEPIS
ncbi:MAG: hypothetical protein MHPSP_003881 [Paramarteilia canceri]